MEDACDDDENTEEEDLEEETGNYNMFPELKRFGACHDSASCLEC